MAVPGKQTFDGPIPGASLTDELGSKPDEKPAVYADPVDAYEYLSDSLIDDEVFQRIAVASEIGVPVELTVRALLFAGWAEGKYSLDTMFYISVPILDLVLSLLEEGGVDHVPAAARKEDKSLEKAFKILKAQKEEINESLSDKDFEDDEMLDAEDIEEEEQEEIEEEDQDEVPSGGLMGRPEDG